MVVQGWEILMEEPDLNLISGAHYFVADQNPKRERVLCLGEVLLQNV